LPAWSWMADGWLLLLVGMLLLINDSVAGQAGETFTNPFISHGADPWIIRYLDTYLYCSSRGGQVMVSRTSRLHELERAAAVPVWTSEPGKPYSKDLWAPELHFLDGAWWIYVAA